MKEISLFLKSRKISLPTNDQSKQPLYLICCVWIKQFEKYWQSMSNLMIP